MDEERGFYWTVDGEREIKKDPDAELRYVFDWTDWLGADTISQAAIAITDTDVDTPLAVDGVPTIVSGVKVQVRLTGGAVKDRAKVACKITTAAGDVDERTFFVRVVER